MNSSSYIKKCFEQNKIIDPTGFYPNIMHLVRAIWSSRAPSLSRIPPYFNAKDIEAINHLKTKFGPTQHTVMVLIDGMGSCFRDKWPFEGFFASHFDQDIYSLFPSTTASVLTSVCTGLWPSQHGIPGWWIYLNDQQKSIVPIPFEERFSDKPLEEIGIQSKDVFTVPSILFDQLDNCLIFYPPSIVNTTYSHYFANDVRQVGYTDVRDGVNKIIEYLQNVSEPTSIYWYIPDLDHKSHLYGVDHDDCNNLIKELDHQFGRLFSEMPSNSTIAITADHGLVDVPSNDHIILRKKDRIMEYLKAPISGEPSVPIFHVKDHLENQFLEYFYSEYGKQFTLVSISELEDLKLFGPYPLTPVMRERLGSFIGISVEPFTLQYLDNDKPPNNFKAYHAGLRKAEVEVPLIIART